MINDELMTDWWQSPLGQYVLTQENKTAPLFKSHIYGDYHLQLFGLASHLEPFQHINHRFQLAEGADVKACGERLPFKSESIDSVLLPHVIEFSSDPHQLLREVDRILVEDGVLVMYCFNPFSLWGLKRVFSWQDSAPWHGHYYTRARLKDWLALLNFELVTVENVVFRPPVNSDKWLAKMAVIDQWGQRLWPVLSVVSILVAKKCTVPLTPVKLRWRKQGFFQPGRLIKPATGYNTQQKP
jgi:SAM-dependent methyltransferase